MESPIHQHGTTWEYEYGRNAQWGYPESFGEPGRGTKTCGAANTVAVFDNNYDF